MEPKTRFSVRPGGRHRGVGRVEKIRMKDGVTYAAHAVCGEIVTRRVTDTFQAVKDKGGGRRAEGGRKG